MDDTERSQIHATLVIERTYPAPAAAVWHARSDNDARDQWLTAGEVFQTFQKSHEFRVGGHGIEDGQWHGGPRSRFHSTYTDIVDQRRIVFTYDMWADGQHMSTSLTTIALEPDGGQTHLTYTEQGVHLDGLDSPKAAKKAPRDFSTNSASTFPGAAREEVHTSTTWWAASTSPPCVTTRSGGLPQLDPIALRIGDPAEPADTLHVLRFVGHVRSHGAQLRDHRIQVADPEVEHGLLGAGPEVAGLRFERREHRRPGSLTPQAVLIRVQAQAIAIPRAQGRRVGGPDEVSTDSKHTFHAAIVPGRRPGGPAPRQRPREARRRSWHQTARSG